MTAPRPLRIAVVGDLDSIHTLRWLRAFAARGHEMHAVSFYRPRGDVPAGVTLHVLREGAAGSRDASRTVQGLRRFVPAWLIRPLHGARYLRAGLRQTLRHIAPDIVHAHFVVEYGFYSALAGLKPLVVSAWGSDVYLAPRNPLTNLIARWTLRHAALVTGSDPAMLSALRRLGVSDERVHLVRIGALEEGFFDPQPVSVNTGGAGTPPTVISTRALEPLYNVETVLRAFSRARKHVPGAHLLMAHEGSQRAALGALAVELDLGDSVSFLGRLTPEQMRDALSMAQVYVSVPSSDSMPASTMEAMARGCFPVVSDLPSQDGFIEHGVTGLRVTAGDVPTLALALQRALVDATLRHGAVAANRATVEAEGRLSDQVVRLEEALRPLLSDTHP